MGFGIGFCMGLPQKEFRHLQVKAQNEEIQKKRVFISKCNDKINVLPKR